MSDYKLYRAKPVIQVLVQTFEKMYNPHREQAIDKAMVKVKGRIGFLQYMPMKPCKFGVNVIQSMAICASLKPSSANNQNHRLHCCPVKPKDQSMPLFADWRGLLLTKITVFMDNFISGISLFQELLREKIYCCGTLRKNRKGFPQSLKTVKLKEQGESKQRGCTIWRDKAANKPVTILSSQCYPVSGDQVKRRKKQGWQWVDVMINHPASITCYDKFMSGVDMHNQARRAEVLKTHTQICEMVEVLVLVLPWCCNC